jgi:small-conductance mechanosensitive channel
VGIFFAFLGVLNNLFGRFSLSGMVGIAGIFAVTQALVLTIFVEVIIEIFLLQLLSSRLKKGIGKPFDTGLVVNKIKMPLILVAILLWLIMLTSNLNLYNVISKDITDALTSTRTIGSISFQWLSVILFFLIIWFAHILQRLVGYFFGETGAESEDITIETKGQHSRLLITRLLVLIGGYILAIAASGLPIDKLTFLLGALGVGIGMGLQGIVNNVVSGIVLIFEGSLKIGDEIEASGQAGKVKEIGLRASTLTTADGADVIIPNGNILSQNIVNWTFSSNEKRVMLTFTLWGKELDANMINEVINNTIQKIPNVTSKRKPVILFTKVTSEFCSLTIRFWSTITNVDQVKSEAVILLSAAFADRNIEFE